MVGANVTGSDSFSKEAEHSWDIEVGDATSPQEREISRAVRSGCLLGV
jgi:hypothetical protein